MVQIQGFVKSVFWGNDRKVFLEKAKEMGYTQEQIDLIVKDMEEDIALGLPVDWSSCLIELPISD